MANIKSLADLNGEDGDDDNRKHNDYYAGGEKRHVNDRTACLRPCAVQNSCCGDQATTDKACCRPVHVLQWPAD